MIWLMIKKVVWSPEAKRDIKEIKDFYDKRNKSKSYSNKLLKIFRDAAEFIEKFPESSYKTNRENIRGFVIKDYILFYEILSTQILVLTVWDSRRNPEQLTERIPKQ